MKKIKTTVALLAILFIAACSNAPDSDKAKTGEAKDVNTSTGDETWVVDPAESKVEWIGTKVSGYHTGTINIENGTINVVEGNVSGGKFTMDMKSMIISGPEGSDPESNTKLLSHLKSSDFFDIEKHPEATFEITGVQAFSGTVEDAEDPRQASISKYKVANPTHTVSGNLTMKGITKNIEFPAQITVNGNVAEAIAKFNIDRSQWEIVYPGKPDDLIRNEIHIGVKMKATKAVS